MPDEALTFRRTHLPDPVDVAREGKLGNPSAVLLFPAAATIPFIRKRYRIVA